MSLAALLIQDVTLVEPGAVDSHGDASADGSPVTVKGRLDPSLMSEDVTSGDMTVDTATLFLAPDAPVTGRTIATVDGQQWQVDGAPVPLQGRSGAHHYELRVRRITDARA